MLAVRQSISEEVQARLSRLVEDRKVPGLQYIVVTPQEVIVEYAGGMAGISVGRKMNPTTTLMAYSMSKTITAVAVMQLVGSGSLSLDSRLADLYPDSPYDKRITVAQLLHHTSGIPNPIPLRWVHPTDEHASFDESKALSAVLTKHPRTSSTPGNRFAYSNIGYWLLGKVIEAVTGLSFVDYVRTKVIAPLGLTPTELGFHIYDQGNHAAGYLEKYSLFNLAKRFLIDPRLIGPYENGWLRINSHYVNGPAFGGLVGSARAFARFLQDQLSERSVLLDDRTREHMFEIQRTEAGNEIPMTLGWHTSTINGRRCFFKEGGGGGFHVMMRLYRQQRIGSVVMTNGTGFDVGALMNRIDPLCLA